MCHEFATVETSRITKLSWESCRVDISVPCSISKLVGLIPGSGRSSGEENGNPLQYSCLENPTDSGVWRTTVHGVTRVGHDLATKPQPHSKYVSLGSCFRLVRLYLFVWPCKISFEQSFLANELESYYLILQNLPGTWDWSFLILCIGLRCGSVVKNPPANTGDIRDEGSILDQEDPLEKEMATNANIVAWEIPQIEEYGKLQPRRFQKSWTGLIDQTTDPVYL